MLDIQELRAQFPVLQKKVNGKPLVYLDNGATTQKPLCVINSIERLYKEYNSNIHRGVHLLSRLSTEANEGAREIVRQFINARKTEEIIFTTGTTGSINLVANSFAEAFMEEGDEVIVSQMEHHSNIVPWQLVGKRRGIKLKVVALNADGSLDMQHLASLFNDRTKLVALAHVSNVMGVINPVKQIVELAHNHNVPVLLDGAQAIAHIPLDVQSLDVDFYAFSGHKVYGPTGIGVLYGKEKWLEQMPPYMGGGEMIGKVSFEETTFNELPFKFEAGTPNYEGAIALGEALKFLSDLGVREVSEYEHQLLTYATEQLSAIDGLKIFGTSQEKGAVISFLVGDIHHYDMGMLLDQLGIAVRTGHHCAEPLMHYLGIEGTVRASMALYNTFEEVDQLAAGIKRVAKMF